MSLGGDISIIAIAVVLVMIVIAVFFVLKISQFLQTTLHTPIINDRD
jgi:hypothetical protein